MQAYNCKLCSVFERPLDQQRHVSFQWSMSASGVEEQHDFAWKHFKKAGRLCPCVYKALTCLSKDLSLSRQGGQLGRGEKVLLAQQLYSSDMVYPISTARSLHGQPWLAASCTIELQAQACLLSQLLPVLEPLKPAIKHGLMGNADHLQMPVALLRRLDHCNIVQDNKLAQICELSPQLGQLGWRTLR